MHKRFKVLQTGESETGPGVSVTLFLNKKKEWDRMFLTYNSKRICEDEYTKKYYES